MESTEMSTFLQKCVCVLGGGVAIGIPIGRETGNKYPPLPHGVPEATHTHSVPQILPPPS